MGILNDINITIDEGTSFASKYVIKDLRYTIRDFLKRYTQDGWIETHRYWNNGVIEANKFGVETRGHGDNTHDYRVYFRRIIKYNYDVYNNFETPFESDLIYVDTPCLSNSSGNYCNQVWASQVVPSVEDDNVVLKPSIYNYPIVIKGYPGKDLPDYMLFRGTTFKHHSDYKEIKHDIEINPTIYFLLINCNLTKENIENHVLDAYKTNIIIESIETI